MRVLVCALALASGCYSYGLRKIEPPPADALASGSADARICVLRPQVIAFAVTAVVRDDGVLVGATRGASWFCFRAQPGHHELTSAADDVQRATLDVQPGGRYYLRQIVDNLAGFVRTRLAWVDALEAQKDMAHAAYRVLSSVPGDERLPTDAPVPALAARGAT